MQLALCKLYIVHPQFDVYEYYNILLCGGSVEIMAQNQHLEPVNFVQIDNRLALN